VDREIPLKGLRNIGTGIWNNQKPAYGKATASNNFHSSRPDGRLLIEPF